MLNKAIDIACLSQEFSSTGRVRIDEVLEPEIAAAILQRLETWHPWQLVTVIGGEHKMFDAAGMNQLDSTQRLPFDALVTAGARLGFQYLFENCPLYDMNREGTLSDPVLRKAFDLLRSENFLELARSVSQNTEISFSDAQATRYRPGHFLTVHDDELDGKNRVVAYVLNLTREWRADFGGQLQFLSLNGHVQEAWVPGFNTLSLFRVPASHAVSVVAPFASGARYAITGWLRTGAEPEID